MLRQWYTLNLPLTLLIHTYLLTYQQVHIIFISNETYNNALYFQFAVVHCFNACMYAYAWNDKSWTSFYMYPEYLNIIGSGLYLWSSTMYNEWYESDDYYADYSTDFALCRKAELAAAIVEWFAAIGWNYVWYAQFEIDRGTILTYFVSHTYLLVCLLHRFHVYSYNLDTRIDNF